MLAWMKHKLESRLPGEISITLDRQMTPPLWQKGRTKEPLDERGKGKSCLKFNILKTKIMASCPITLWEIDGGQWKQCQTLFFGAPKSLWILKLNDACSLEEKL